MAGDSQIVGTNGRACSAQQGELGGIVLTNVAVHAAEDGHNTGQVILATQDLGLLGAALGTLDSSRIHWACTSGVIIKARTPEEFA